MIVLSLADQIGLKSRFQLSELRDEALIHSGTNASPEKQGPARNQGGIAFLVR